MGGSWLVDSYTKYNYLWLSNSQYLPLVVWWGGPHAYMGHMLTDYVSSFESHSYIISLCSKVHFLNSSSYSSHITLTLLIYLFRLYYAQRFSYSSHYIPTSKWHKPRNTTPKRTLSSLALTANVYLGPAHQLTPMTMALYLIAVRFQPFLI